MSDLFWSREVPRIEMGDALDLIEQVPPDSVDVLFADPPYSFGGRGDENAVSAAVPRILAEAGKRVKRTGIAIVLCASSWRSVEFTRVSLRNVLQPVRLLTWVKTETRSGKLLGPWGWETTQALVFVHPRGKVVRPIVATSYCLEPPMPHRERGHPAQLPEGVLRWLISPINEPGGNFLDPFAGSGSAVALACALGMRAVGFELREEWADEAQARVLAQEGEMIARGARPPSSESPP